MTASHLKIDLNSWGTGAVELDGHRVENEIAAIDVHLRAGQINAATIELLVPQVELAGPAEVRLSEDTMAMLKRLGWTPPEEATP